jgi:DNA-binding NarL/FixJ family response regulator
MCFVGRRHSGHRPLECDYQRQRDIARLLPEMCPHAKVIVVGSSEDDESELVACAEAGVAGYHLRTEWLDDLHVLTSKVLDGESACSPRVFAIMFNRLSTLAAQRQPEAKERVLMAYEIQILRMLEMACRIETSRTGCVALYTAKSHVHSVLGKLGGHAGSGGGGSRTHFNTPTRARRI